MDTLRPVDRREAWEHLVSAPASVRVLQSDDLADLPDPAQRYLSAALDAGAVLSPIVIVEMEGEVKLKRWLPFRARQVLRAGSGFVWEATVGRVPFLFRGGDVYWEGRGTLDFRLWSLLPIARAVGPDMDRSAAGRFAAETVAWMPQALIPRAGAQWRAVDDGHAVVAVPVGGEPIEVSVAVDREGALKEVTMQRWGDPVPGHFDWYPFGGSFEAYGEFGGVSIPTAGRVGWWWGTDRQEEGEFFRYRITGARHLIPE